MSLKQQILDDVKMAMKAQEKEKLAVLRMVTAALKQVEVDERKELTDEDVLNILTAMVKQRRDSIVQFTPQRMDLVAQEEKEITIISVYLPKALTEIEIENLIQSALEKTQANSVKDLGKVIGMIRPHIGAMDDMSKISSTIKNKLMQLGG